METKQDKLNRICQYRGLPKIKIGQPCIVNGKKGLIVSANSSCNLDVRFADTGLTNNCHPYWKMKILTMDRKETLFQHKDKDDE